MSNEITCLTRLKVSNGDLTEDRNVTTKIDQHTQQYYRTVETIGVTQTLIDPITVTTPGLVFLQNLDPVNYIVYGWDNLGENEYGTEYTHKLKAGETAIFRLNGFASVVFYAIADTAPCRLDILVLGD